MCVTDDEEEQIPAATLLNRVEKTFQEEFWSPNTCLGHVLSLGHTMLPHIFLAADMRPLKIKLKFMIMDNEVNKMNACFGTNLKV